MVHCTPLAAVVAPATSAMVLPVWLIAAVHSLIPSLLLATSPSPNRRTGAVLAA